MKVVIKRGTVKYEGIRYAAGETLDITQRFYDANQQRFEPVADAPTKPKAKSKGKSKPKAPLQVEIVVDAPEAVEE